MMSYSNMVKKIPLLTLALASVVVAGCSGKPLALEEKNRFDGKWVAQIDNTFPRQRRNGWKLFCQNMQGELAFTVVDGVMTTALLGDDVQIPIRAGGKFSLSETSTDFRARSLTSSSEKLFDGRVTNTLRGSLGGNNPKGALDNWVREAVSGCTTRVKFVREDSTDGVIQNGAPNLLPQFANFDLRLRSSDLDFD